MNDHTQSESSIERSLHLIRTADDARSCTFEVKNLLAQRLEKLEALIGSDPSPTELRQAEYRNALQAALDAAETAAKSQSVLHRNLHTVLGYDHERASLPQAQPVDMSEYQQGGAIVHNVVGHTY